MRVKNSDLGMHLRGLFIEDVHYVVRFFVIYPPTPPLLLPFFKTFYTIY